LRYPAGTLAYSYLDQFRSRYATHKLPVRSLFHGKLIEKLRAAGSTVTVPKEVEEQVLSEMAAQDEDPSLVEHSDAEVDIENVEAATKTPRSHLSDEFNINVVQDDLDGMRNRFVNLVDLIPPLPKKGDFEVSTIKNSPYFFS
jgi:DNA-directed RNA polymerase, mitochondrial